MNTRIARSVSLSSHTIVQACVQQRYRPCVPCATRHGYDAPPNSCSMAKTCFHACNTFRKGLQWPTASFEPLVQRAPALPTVNKIPLQVDRRHSPPIPQPEVYIPHPKPSNPSPCWSGLCLARNEGMDPCSFCYITHHTSFHFPFPSSIPS